jgi:large subunit ribosomal protein L18
MNKIKKLNQKKIRRAKRTKATIQSAQSLPRLAVFRSNKYISAQIIDDKKGHTLAFAGSRSIKDASKKTTKTEDAFSIGVAIAIKAKEIGIKKVVFDRRSYRFHGRVKRLVDGAKKSGLEI